MSLSFSEEQHAFRSSVRGVLERLGSFGDTRDLVDDRGPDPNETWARIDDALTLSALPIPEELGGQGGSWSEVGIVFEEMGRTLVPTPFLALMAAARTLSSCHTAESESRLSGLAAGVSPPMVAYTGNAPGRFELAAGAGLRSGADVVVHGTSGLTAFHPTADSVIVEAQGVEGPLLVALAARDLRIEPVPTIDLTRPMCIVTADAASGTVVASEDVRSIVEDTRSFVAVSVALESIGGADACLAMTADYARNRVQFGKAIGSFQGVKHRLADLLRAFEPAKSAAYAALDAIASEPDDDARRTASIAKLVTDQMYADVSIESVQLHGAIGFTWELGLHLHYKRAIANRALGASARAHRESLRNAILELAQTRSPIAESA